MTANEAKKHLKICKEGRLFIPKNDVLDTAIQSLEEIQEYRAIGTVEELIKEHKELIELSRRYLIDTNELLEYQAIGTVEQLKAIKQWKSDVMEGFCKYDASSFEEIVVNARAKAIDEFAERIALEISESIIWGMLPTDCKDGVSDEIVDYVIDTSKKIAEQMKAGGKNEINRWG